METAKSMKQALSEIYKYRIELHAHTSPVSHCGNVSPQEQVELYKEKGYDAIVITNLFIRSYTDGNNEIAYLSGETKKERIDFYLSDYEKAREHGEKLGIRVILGAELRFAENSNDYLLYGVDRDILEKSYDLLPHGLEKFREELKLQKSVLVWAHPKRNGMSPCDTSLVDGIETFNMHPAHNGRIGVAARFADQQKVGFVTCGSDCHNDVEGVVGVSALRTKELPSDSFGLAELLKKGDYIFEIGESSFVLP